MFHVIMNILLRTFGYTTAGGKTYYGRRLQCARWLQVGTVGYVCSSHGGTKHAGFKSCDPVSAVLSVSGPDSRPSKRMLLGWDVRVKLR